MSLNYEHVGIPIAMVLSKSDNKQPRIICLQDYDGDAKTSFKEIKLDKNNEYFQSIGDPKQERSINYIIGRSGSGKSYYIKQWIQQYYKKLYKKRDVYLFSLLENDKTLDELKFIKRILLNDDFASDNEICVKDFKDSLLIFDDTDCIKDKKIKLKVDKILDEVLQVGKHYNISALITRHTACNSKDTKMILAESHSYVIFPNGLGNKAITYLLDNYLGLDKKQIKKIKGLKSRAITINRTFPMSVVSEKECFTIDNNIDE